jgi:N-acyl-phosphatidylethanolamine-hydrolysing phospholipase D
MKKNDSIFKNTHSDKNLGGFWNVLLWKTGYYDDPRPTKRPPENFNFPQFPTFCSSEKPHAVWLNHSSFLIQIPGSITILTDPVWSNACSPVTWLGPKRKHLPPIPLHDLHLIDVVLLSHNHYDHLDKKTIIALHKKFPDILFIVPLGVRKWFEKHKIFRTIELSWWESFSYQGSLFHAVPAQHFSGRGILDRNKTLWCGFVVETILPEEKKTFYFAGDTGYNSTDFKEIGKRFENIDLSLIPIGSYLPERFMSPIHISPVKAVEIHKDIKSKLSLAMHWKTFSLGDEPLDQPPYDLFLALQKEKIPYAKFQAIEPGTYVNF